MVTRRPISILALTAFVLGAVLALPAGAAASAWQVVDDCTADGDLDRSYSDRELRDAVPQLETDDLEYGDCKQVISAAIGAGEDTRGDRSAGGGPGGSASPVEQAAQQGDRDALAAVSAKASDDPIEVGGKHLRPGDNGLFDTAATDNGLPTPLLLILIALAVGALGTGVWLLRGHLPRRLLPR